MVWYAAIDVLGETQMDEDLKLIFNAIEAGKCLPFLGAGASMDFTDAAGKLNKGLPTGYGLAKTLAEKSGHRNGNNFDLLKLAESFVYLHNGSREELERTVMETLTTGCAVRPIHTVLAQLLKVKIVLTSNYDTLLEDALKQYQRLLKVHFYNPRNARTGHFQGTIFFDDRDVIVHKMHGCIDHPESIVITRSDYIRYLANLNDIDRGMPEYFRKTIMPQFTLLFLGYSLEDWNFQVLWEGVLTAHQRSGVRKYSYALVKNSTDFQKRFWLSRNIILLDMDITEFSIKLAEHFNLEIPQLGITKKEGEDS